MTDDDKALVKRNKGHTPGPWIFRRRKYGNGFTREIWSSSGLFIASLTTRMTGCDATEANANLIASAPAMMDRIEAQAAEIERLRERLREAHWFYLGDDCSSDQCRFGIDDCISEDFEWDNPPMGDHVLQISGARQVPDMWVALHYFSEEEKDERDDDEPYSYTVHATEEEARAALGETNG